MVEVKTRKHGENLQFDDLFAYIGGFSCFQLLQFLIIGKYIYYIWLEKKYGREIQALNT